jgi:hypothetical protein
MCGDSGFNSAIPDFDDSESVDNILMPDQSDVARAHQIYTIGDLRQKRRNLGEIIDDAELAQAMISKLDENDGREP